MFEDLAAQTSDAYWSVVGWLVSVTFLVYRADSGVPPVFGDNCSVQRQLEEISEGRSDGMGCFFQKSGAEIVWSGGFVMVEIPELLVDPIGGNCDVWHCAVVVDYVILLLVLLVGGED